jgi:hypothetical protein
MASSLASLIIGNDTDAYQREFMPVGSSKEEFVARCSLGLHGGLTPSLYHFRFPLLMPFMYCPDLVITMISRPCFRATLTK